jgi:hypothetical protein
MSRRTVDPTKIKTLRDWAKRWPVTGNLGWDAETGEPAVFDSAGEGRKQVSKIPWVREGDVMTILAQPTRFAPGAVKAAEGRLAAQREQRESFYAAGAEQLRAAEATLLNAWRAYKAADPMSRPMFRRDVAAAETAVREMEAALSAQVQAGRQVSSHMGASQIYVPPVPLSKRGLALSAVGATNA